MPTYETPQAISVTVELSMGEVRVVASERTDTVVDVRPTNSSRKGDVVRRAANARRVRRRQAARPGPEGVEALAVPRRA